MKHLWKSPSGLYYYRLTIPSRYKDSFDGLGTIKRSLGTYHPTEARLAAQAFHFQVLGVLCKIAQMTNKKPPRNFSELLGETLKPLKVELPNGLALDFDLSKPSEYQEYKAILEGFKGETGFQNLQAAMAAPPPAVAVGKTFQIVAAEYLIHAKAKSLDPRTVKKYESCINRFSEWLGRPTPIQAITPQRWHEFKTYLMTGDAKQGVKPLAAKTVDQYTNAVNEVFKMAKTAQYTVDNPLTGQNIVKRKNREKSEVEKFTDSDLQRIFDPVRLAKIKDPSDAWGPLLALHTGARLGEIFQLTVDDIKQVNGIDCVEFTEARKDANLKTSASARITPLHPRLRQLGFFEYVQAVKDLPNGNGRLFPWLNKYEQGYGDVPSQRFTALLQDLDIWVFRRKVFNSFRHTAQTALQRAGIDGVIRKHFIGHEAADITVNVYGEHTPINILADACLPALAFPAVPWEKVRLNTALIKAELERLFKTRRKKPI